MALIKKLIFVLLLSSIGNACSNHGKPPELHEQPSFLLPDRNEAVNFFSRMHTWIRDTERASYGFLYGVRDGVDSFIYDAQKDYYQDYQK